MFPSEKEFLAEAEFASQGDLSPVTLEQTDREQLPVRCCGLAGSQQLPEPWELPGAGAAPCRVTHSVPGWTRVPFPGDTETTCPGSPGMGSREGGFRDLQRSHETRPILKFLSKCSDSSCPPPIHPGTSPAWLSQAEPINALGMMSQGLHPPRPTQHSHHSLHAPVLPGSGEFFAQMREFLPRASTFEPHAESLCQPRPWDHPHRKACPWKGNNSWGSSQEQCRECTSATSILCHTRKWCA